MAVFFLSHMGLLAPSERSFMCQSSLLLSSPHCFSHLLWFDGMLIEHSATAKDSHAFFSWNFLLMKMEKCGVAGGQTYRAFSCKISQLQMAGLSRQESSPQPLPLLLLLTHKHCRNKSMCVIIA
jgi:hypothetical protein